MSNDDVTSAVTDPTVTSSGVADDDADGVPDAFEKLLVLGMTLAAAAVARKVVAVVWKASTGRTPPGGDDDRGDASVVLLWGAVAGAAVGAARLVAERQARSVARRRRA